MRYLILLMCLLPFVVITLRATLFQKTDADRITEFFSSDKPCDKLLICMNGQCPSLNLRTIKLTGTPHEIHSSFLAILLQLNTVQTKLVISAQKALHSSIKESLKNIDIDYLLVQ